MSVTAAIPARGTRSDALRSDDESKLRAAGFGQSAAPRSRVIEGIVLAGVHPWGHSVLDYFVCWPLVPIAGRPLLAHTLGWLRSAGIRTTSICANSDTLAVSRALRDGRGFDIDLHYYEDRMPRGPAGCIRDVMTDRTASLYVVVDGSVLPRIDLPALLEAHERSGALLTIAAISVAGKSDRGRKLTPAGAYVISKEVAAHIGQAGYQDLKEKLIPSLYAEGLPVCVHVVDGPALPRVRCAASYLTVCKWVTASLIRERSAPSEYRAEGEAWVHETARIGRGAKLIGPVLIDAECIVEPDVVVVGPTTLGRACRVGSQSVISRSAIWSFCRIGSTAIVDDCVVADHVSINNGAVRRNTVCVNTDASISGAAVASVSLNGEQ